MKTLMNLRKEVSHGGVIPRGWRIAWYEPRRRIGVYFPAPVHWLARVLRELRHRVRVALRAPGVELAEVFQMQRAHREREHMAEEYARGYMVGWRECFQTCLSAVEEEIARVDEPWDAGSSCRPRPSLRANRTERSCLQLCTPTKSQAHERPGSATNPARRKNES